MSHRPGFEAREFFDILPPIAGASGTAPAAICLAAGTGQVTVDLTSLPGSQLNAALAPGNDAYNPNPLGHFLFLQADGADIYVAFGPTLASLTGGNALAPATPSTVANNVVTPVAGGCILLKNGIQPARFRLPANTNTRDNADVGASSPARFLGFLTSTGSGTLRLYQVGP